MKFRIFVHLLSFFFWCQGGKSVLAASTGVVVASCNSTCNCTMVPTQPLDAFEFRAICRGDGTQSVVLDDSLFAAERAPTNTRNVYVRVHNFMSTRVQSEFLSWWLAYPSCSLDIWNAGKVSFPKQAPPLVETQVKFYFFAGIGLAGSSTDRFPDDIFKGKQASGLKLQHATINYLNLLRLSQKHLKYLIAKDSVIKVLEGNPFHPLHLEKSSISFEAKVEIESCRIGYVSEGALAFTDHKTSFKKPSIHISKSMIGIIETSSINLSKEIEFKMESTVIAYVSPFAFKLANERNASLSIKHNMLGSVEESLINLKCGPLLDFSSNYIEALQECIFSESEEENETCFLSGCNELSCYIDASCDNNHILSNIINNETTTEPPTTTTMPTTTTSGIISTVTSTTTLTMTATPPTTTTQSTTTTSTTPNIATTTSTTPTPTTTTTFATPNTTRTTFTPQETTSFTTQKTTIFTTQKTTSATVATEPSTTTTPTTEEYTTPKKVIKPTTTSTTPNITTTSTTPTTQSTRLKITATFTMPKATTIITTTPRSTTLTEPRFDVNLCNSTELTNASNATQTVSIHWLYLAIFFCIVLALLVLMLLRHVMKGRLTKYSYVVEARYSPPSATGTPPSTSNSVELGQRKTEGSVEEKENLIILDEKDDSSIL